MENEHGMKKILVVEDERSIAQVLTINLKMAGYACDVAGDGEEGLRLALTGDYDLILLDIMLPKRDGFSVCREVRKTLSTPIIMVTAKEEELDKIMGLDLGADDYVTKPFSPVILVKRVEALLRRASTSGSTSAEREFSDLFFNDEAHEVKLEGKEVELTLKEYNILKALLESSGRVFSREQLLDSIWGYDFTGDIRTVDSHVARLRTKLGDWGNKHLKTVYGIGYKIEES